MSDTLSVSHTTTGPSVDESATHETGDGGSSRRERTAELFAELAATTDPAGRTRLRDELVLVNLPVATGIALRYRGRGEALEDLTQVAHLALITAVDGFDPSRGYDFLAYAVPTVRGAVRRHFRDKAWDVRPPRRIQELRAKVEAAGEELAHELGRSPRPSELAAHLGVDVDDVSECLASGEWYHVQSLDAPTSGSDGSELSDLLGADDPALELVEARISVQPLLARLKPRERRILILRFYRGWTQQQIGADIGVSQMQVSRLLAGALRQLREQLEAERAA